MSTDTAGNGDDPAAETITLARMEDGNCWVARDEETGVASQGETREEALEMLDEAVALHKGEIGHEPTAEELREMGIDPDRNDSESGELPEFMK